MAWIRACGGGSPAIPDGKTVTPINDVTIWQQCAGIANPTYTTLAEVLADTGILQTLMASDNAVDYLARSKTFASDVCADSNAMTYIGQNNYASNTLLADSDWLDAICNSTYFESVLNVKVPTMTSNNTPSGEASASSILSSNYDAYRAFDGTNTNWASNYNDGAGAYIQYQFSSPNKIKKIVLNMIVGSSDVPLSSSIDWILKGSSDGTDFDDHVLASNVKNGVNSEITTIINNNTAFSYYRLVATGYTYDAPSLKDVQIGKLQFYGRKDV